MTFLLIFGVHLGFTSSDVILAPGATPAILVLSLLLLYQLPPLFNRLNTLHRIFETNTLTLTALHSSACIMLCVMCKLLGVLVLADEFVVGLGLVLADELVVRLEGGSGWCCWRTSWWLTGGGLDVLELLC